MTNYPKTLRVTRVWEKEFTTQEEVEKYIQSHVPDGRYAVGYTPSQTDVDESLLATPQEALDADYPDTGLKAPINTLDQLVKMVKFDLDTGDMDEGDYFDNDDGTVTIEVV